MSVWGKTSPFKSCESLLKRLEENDPSLTEVVILPTKSFGATEIGRICAVLENATSDLHFSSLTASGHRLSNDNLKRLGKAIKGTAAPMFRSLSVGDSTMGDEGVVALCEGLASYTGKEDHHCVLERIDLSYKNMSYEGFKASILLLGRLQGLHQLDLSRNPEIGRAGIETMDEPEVALFSQLVDFDLSDCQISGKFASCFLPFLSSGSFSSGRSIRLAKNPIGTDGILALVPLLGWTTALYIADCDVHDDGIEKFIPSDPKCILEVLDISRNSISVDGIRSFSRCLSCCGTSARGYFFDLRELYVAGNPLDEAGVRALVEALQKRREASLPSLSVLDLSETSCGIAGAMFAAKESFATSLVLFNNKIGSQGFRDIAVSLPDILATGIESLDLAGNSADNESVIDLLKAFLKHETEAPHPSQLKTLVVGGNGNGSEALEEIVQQIKEIRPDVDIARDRPAKR